eukprot:1108965-Karenia_brevis.AAC.1
MPAYHEENFEDIMPEQGNQEDGSSLGEAYETWKERAQKELGRMLGIEVSGIGREYQVKQVNPETGLREGRTARK